MDGAVLVAPEKESGATALTFSEPPDVVRAIYLTGWSASVASRIDYVIELARTDKINAVVIDVKDFSGAIVYPIETPELAVYKGQGSKISSIQALLGRLHKEGMYVIARITVFQDPVLARARPDLAVHSKAKLVELQELTPTSLWLDLKGLAWIDPAAKEAWDYSVALAKDAASRGFDELNFDYIRFPSDGNLQDMVFPLWDGGTPKHEVIREFFQYLRAQLPGIRISADLFGLSTSHTSDLGVGQIIEDAYEYFDYVSPMLYPSHFADMFLGYPKPAEYPYEIVAYSLENARIRLETLGRQLLEKEGLQEKKLAKLRPWLQDFDLGADYDAGMVQAQIQATKDVIGEKFAGFLLWSPTNFYTRDALGPFEFDKDAYNRRERTTF
ncbi:MAG: putative glycoside hydrolase [Patescibacteria group bacterium]